MFTSETTRRRLFSCIATGAITIAALAHAGGNTDAKRIVAIGGSVTEIIYALGEEKRLIARDTTSNFPADANKLPDVGYIRALSSEGVLSVNPDLIVALGGSGPKETVDVLKQAAVTYVEIEDKFDAHGVVSKIEAVGAAIGVPDKAKTLANKAAADLKAAEAQAKASGKSPRTVFILSMQGGKVMAAGADTAANGILSMAGATNVFSDFTGYKQVADEAMLKAAPEVIVMMDRTGDHAADNSEFLALPALADSPAVRNGNIIRMDGNYMLGFGPRTAQVVRDLAASFAKIEVSK